MSNFFLLHKCIFTRIIKKKLYRWCLVCFKEPFSPVNMFDSCRVEAGIVTSNYGLF